MLKTKSVYDPIKKTDGLRILATRFRGRGMKSNRYHVWMANLGPSEKLLKSFQADYDWKKFTRLYKEELLPDDRNDKNNKTIRNHGQKFTLRLIARLAKKQTITLMCHCDTGQEQCHLRILEKLIKRV